MSRHALGIGLSLICSLGLLAERASAQGRTSGATGGATGASSFGSGSFGGASGTSSFGSGSFGSGSFGSTGTGAGGFGQTGAGQAGSGAFTSFAPTAQGFVGSDSADSQQIQQATSGGQQQMGQQGVQRSAQNRGRNLNEQQGSPPSIRVKLKVGFDYAPQSVTVTNQRVATVLDTVLNEKLSQRGIPMPDVTFDGRIVTLRGEVPSEAAGKLIVNLVKLQPGVDRVVSQLTVAEILAEPIGPGTAN